MAKLEQEGKSADSQLNPVSLSTSTFSEYSYSSNLFIQLPGLKKKENNRNLIGCVPPCYMEDTQENWVTP